MSQLAAEKDSTVLLSFKALNKNIQNIYISIKKERKKQTDR